jgi:predicted sugar kinase
MLIEIASPALLTLGALRLEGKTHLLGLALQYPPVSLFAQAFDGLKVTGARADEARRQAERYFGSTAIPPNAEIEIELATPAHVGLGSGPMLGLSIARACAWLGDQPDEVEALAHALAFEPTHGLYKHGFAQGGLLLVDETGGLIRRETIEHPTESAWAFVFVFPKTPAGTPLMFEDDRLQTLLAAAPRMDGEGSQKANDRLWSAVVGDDLASFAEALMSVQNLNASAQTLTSEEQSILNIMRDGGALAYGRTATGIGLYGLIQGDEASIRLRQKLQNHIGYFGGTVMASIADNTGARHAVKDETLLERSLRDT